MNIKELIEQLSKLPPEAKIAIEGSRGHGYDYDSCNLVLDEGYFVGDGYEPNTGEGLFVGAFNATLPCGDGKPLLDLTSPHITPGVKIRFTRWPGRPLR